jgi:hypothetical protein
VRLNLYAKRMNVAVAVAGTVDAAGAAEVSTTGVATTTCVVTTRTEEEEATTMVEDGEAMTMVEDVEATITMVVVDTMETRVAMEANRTFLNLSQTRGHHHQAARTLCPHRHQAGFHPRNMEDTRAAEAMEVHLGHHQHSAPRGWAMLLHRTGFPHRTKQVATAP